MVLVTGGAGVMGSVLVRRLSQAGKKVRVFTLPGDPHVSRINDYASDIRFGDICRRTDVEGLCDGVTTVYHLAAIIIAFDDSLYRRINVDGTQHVVDEAKRAGVKHFIYVSSASVTYPRPTPYSLSKRACENIVKNAGVPFTIVRPTLVYDTQGGLEFDVFLDYLRTFPVVPFIGTGRAIKRPVFVEDINDAMLALCGNVKAHGKIYNFSGGEAISIREFSRFCLQLMNMGKKKIVTVPVWVCHVTAWIMGILMKRPPLRWPVIAGITQDANLDLSLAHDELGYNPVRVREKLPSCFPRQI